ncbi:MAG: alpha-amylase family glycosyl hydrolase, partial [Propionicimonas sp.]|nr:alpha-amylase family glycosyl hydrolase [Propionicimonas sp.]
WYRAVLPVDNPVVTYRWLVVRPGGYQWVTGRGVFDRDVTDAGDFKVTIHPPTPAWAADAIGYQVFPDRFARSPAAAGRRLPDWAVPASWDDEPLAGGPGTGRQFYGGDLAGVAGHLDHLERLGANLLYLTPFFPSRSNHRYDAGTFAHVDPLLGGDQALAALVAAAGERGIRVIGDLTTNHTGVSHEWFRAARADRGSVEAGFYYWAEHSPISLHDWSASLVEQWGDELPNDAARDVPDYVSWLGVPSLPKLNWGSRELWGRMVSGPDSVVGHYMREPFNLAGWRVDVANMTGRYAGDDFYHAVARAARATVAAANPDGLLIAEHFYDVSRDLPGDGWQSIMNYSAFTKPLWSWLTRPDTEYEFIDLPTPIPRRPGRDVVETMLEFDLAVPWETSARQWNMLDSHDTARITTITGDPRVTEVGVAWLFTYPGIPAVFAGDEGGGLGTTGEHSRTTMPWDQIAAGGGQRWDDAVFEVYRRLIATRRATAPLRDGGLRWAVVEDDAVGYLRETAGERILVVLARAAWDGVRLPRWLVADGAAPELIYGGRLAATPDLRVTREGVEVSAHGPAVGVWRLR